MEKTNTTTLGVELPMNPNTNEVTTTNLRRDENLVFNEYRAAEDGSNRKRELEEELYKLLFRHAMAVCWLVCKESRPDVANESVFRAMKNAKTFKGNAKFSTWFQTIVTNLIKTTKRREAALKEVGLDTIPETGFQTTDAEALLDVHTLRAELEPEEREFLDMKLRGENEAEISEKLGLTAEGVRSKWFRLRKKLSKRLG